MALQHTSCPQASYKVAATALFTQDESIITLVPRRSALIPYGSSSKCSSKDFVQLMGGGCVEIMHPGEPQDSLKDVVWVKI